MSRPKGLTEYGWSGDTAGRSVTRDRTVGGLARGFLDPAEKVEHSAGEERSGRRIVRRQRAVGEVVLITGVEEQLGVVDGCDDLPGRVNVALPDEDRVRVHAVDLDGDSVGPRAEGPVAGEKAQSPVIGMQE